tara:strand:- start:4835 stop:5491 length:657 start_codon:yes stop_codon:yes gene_type:complete
MNQTDYLALGMGGPTLLMHDGDACRDIRGFAVQALEDCVFSQFDLNTFPFVVTTGSSDYIESSTHGSDLVTLTAHEFRTGDKVLLKANGATLPSGLFDDQIYYVVKASADTIKFSLSYPNAIAGTVINTTNDGSGLTTATITKVIDDNQSKHGSGDNKPAFTISGGSSLEITKHVDGNTDMFDTDGAEDVKIPKGMTVYLPVTAITLTTGACIVYTRK